MIRFGNFMFRYRNTVFPVGLVVLIVATPPGPVWGSDWFSPLLDAAALLLALAGEALRVLTVGIEYIKRGGVNRQVFADNLVTGGMFAHCRNPLYVGNLMMAIALFVILGRYSVLIIGVPMILIIYVAIVAAEEKYLRANFPDEYAAYSRSVNRWIPDLRGLGETIRNSDFNWRRVILKETTSFYGWIVVAFLISGLKNKFAVTQPNFQVFLSLCVVATLAFLTIRYLKRIRYLQL